MKHDDGVEGVELVTHHAQVQPNDHRVEHDAEFEDQEGRDLLLEGAVARRFVHAVDFVAFGAELFFESARGRGSGFDVGARGDLGRGVIVGISSTSVRAGVRFAGDGLLHVRVVMDSVFDFDIALGDEIEQKNYNDRVQYDGGTPRIIGPMARHAHACVGSDLAICGIQEMDECRGDDNTSAEVASEEVDVERDMQLADALGYDGEESYGRGDDEDNEQGGDASAQLAVVFIGSGGEIADYLGRVGGGQIDVARVKAVTGGDGRGRHSCGCGR